MKVLLVNGSPNREGCTHTALSEVAATLQKNGIETEMLYLGKKPLAGCIACGNCLKTGHCFRDDVVQEIQARLEEFDGLVVGSPVYYSGPTGQLVSFLNRLFYATEGRMAGKVGAAVVSCRRGRRLGHLRAAQPVFHHLQHAHHLVAVLEFGPWLYARRCAQGPRGAADDARAGAEHGVAAPLHRERTPQRHREAALRAASAHPLHPGQVLTRGGVRAWRRGCLRALRASV